MLLKGLLVVGPHNQQFLLVPEEGVEAAGYTLSVLQLHQDQWVRLQPASSRKLRENMLGALLEFFGNLCRILNHGNDRTHRIKRSTPKNSPSSIRRLPSSSTARMRPLRNNRTSSNQHEQNS